jgi:hypothetical protein
VGGHPQRTEDRRRSGQLSVVKDQEDSEEVNRVKNRKAASRIPVSPPFFDYPIIVRLFA